MVIFYFGFLLGYPLLQVWTLARCRGWWRAFALFCLVPAAPFYAWSAMDSLGYFGGASLGALIVAPLGALPLSYLALIALGSETARKERATVAEREGEPGEVGPGRSQGKPSVAGPIACLVGGVMLSLQIVVLAAVAMGELAVQGSVSAFSVPLLMYLIGLPVGLAASVMDLTRRRRGGWPAGLGLGLTLAGPILFAASIAAGLARF